MTTVKKKRSPGRKVLRVLLILLLIAAVGYAAVVGHVCYQEAHVPAPTDYDAIIVLGAQVLPTGEPSVQLQWRLDKAKEMYDQNPCPVVVCGAQAGTEPEPEAEVMRRVLQKAGVAETDIYMDAESDDTRSNVKNAMTLLAGRQITRPLIVTSDYHLPRAMAIARDAGFAQVQGAGSPCRPEINFWLKNHCREALAWGKYWAEKYLGIDL